MSRKERITDQLGMPFGTACNKLRKNVLFDLLIRLQENKCFKCGELILSANELSIEHKQPWEGRDPNLFWDLKNIAFSHLKCNQPHSRCHEPMGRRMSPEGMNWCIRHKAYLPVDRFAISKFRWTGLHNLCKECDHYNR